MLLSISGYKHCIVYEYTHWKSFLIDPMLRLGWQCTCIHAVLYMLNRGGFFDNFRRPQVLRPELDLRSPLSTQCHSSLSQPMLNAIPSHLVAITRDTIYSFIALLLKGAQG
jgi:hypothetical protein